MMKLGCSPPVDHFSEIDITDDYTVMDDLELISFVVGEVSYVLVQCV